MANEDYPDISIWMKKAYAELVNKTKKAMLAYWDDSLVGILIYQRHKQKANYLHLRRLVVRPDARQRGVASFLLRNTEIDAGKEFKCEYVTTDVKEKNTDTLNFFLSHHYSIVEKKDLYGLGSGLDVILEKKL